MIYTDDDGGEIWTNVATVPMLGDNGQVTGVVTTITDIDERKRAENALRKSEHRAESALLAAEMGTWDYDLVADVCHFDARARELYNLPSGQLDHRPEGVTSVVHPDDIGPMFDEIQRATDLNGEGRYDIVYRIARADGTYRWLRAVGITEFEGSGEARRAVRIVGASRDITFEREAEAALRESETKYRTLFESIDEGFCVVEVLFDGDQRPVDYVFLETNPVFERQTGIPNAVGRRMREIAPEHEQHWFDIYGKIALTGEPRRFELPAEALGRVYDAYAFRIGEAELRHVAILFADITDRKRSEAVLRDSQERQAFLLKLTDALRPIGDAAEIQATTAKLVGEHLGADRAMYAEVEGQRGAEVGTIRGQYVRGQEGRKTAVPFPEHFTFGQFGQHTMAARYRGEPLIVADVQSDPAYSAAERAAWAKFGVSAAVVATLPKCGRLVAEFGVHSVTPRKWTETEIMLIQEAAERTWSAAERARAEAHLRESERRARTLLAELQHRVRNVLAMMRSMVRRAATNKTEVPDFVDHLQGRIDAMARTQSALTRAPGTGVELESIVRDELLAFVAREEAFKVKGPAVTLAPKAAEVLTLAIHELAANSLKYGALGADKDASISWKAHKRGGEKWLELMWEERGLEIEDTDPSPGFGTELVTQRVPYELGGESVMTFRKDGMTATINFPLTDEQSVLQTDSGPDHWKDGL